MKKNILVLSILLMTALLSGCGVSKKEYKEMKREVEDLRDDKDRLEREVNREIERTNEYKIALDKVKEESAERLSTIDYLNSQLADKDYTIASLEDKLENSSSTSSASTSTTKVYSVDPGDSDSYLAKKFWFDGYNYSADTTWYWDTSCKSETKITNCVTIISPVVDDMLQDNGYTVYACMSSNGLVYSSSYPYLVKIN